MKKLLFAVMLCCIPIIGNAQFSNSTYLMKQGISVGLEKNTTAFLNYEWNKGFFVKAKHTVIADRVKYQSFRLDGGYKWDNKYVQLAASPFVTSDWRGSFWNVGMEIGIISNYFSQYFRIGGQYVPYYDCDLNMQHGWSIAGLVNITKEIALFAEYCNKPEYRIAYKKVYTGISFNVKNLAVAPMIEIPIYDGDFHGSHSSVAVNLVYTFINKKKDMSNKEK